MKQLVTIFAVSLCVIQVLSEKFSASDGMVELAASEAVIFDELENFSKNLILENDYIVSKLKTWRKTSKNIASDPERLLHNPISSFLMIKRLYEDIKMIQKRIYWRIDDFSRTIKKIRPSADDLAGAVDGLLRSQTVYHLNTSDIVRGFIDEEKVSDPLSPHDLFIIAREASKLKNRGYFAAEYLNYTKESLTKTRDLFHEVKMRELNELSNVVKNQTKDDPFDNNFVRDGIYRETKEAVIYSRGCRQKIIKNPSESKSLKCRYVSNSAFSKIAPFKVIEADHQSNLVVFLDVITNREIEQIKNLSRAKLDRAKISARGISYGRVSQIAWFKDQKHSIFAKLSKRVEDMTGLTTKTAEPLQMQNYGVGGHYLLHWDMSPTKNNTNDDRLGDRIATLLFYLTTVKKGGATIFPFLKVYVPAIKGSAAFWFNLKSNGDPDLYTRHASCPVIIGTKWVANRWFHEGEQEFRRPCKPENYTENSRFQYSIDIY